MKNPTKGELTKQKILERANTFFNEHGVDHTISKIAVSIGMGKSRITNYFPKKENLVLELLRIYELELARMPLPHRAIGDTADFSVYVENLSRVMDLMFKYRRVISHAMTNSAINSPIFLHIKENYNQNRERTRERLKAFEQNGLVTPTLLEPHVFEAYFFQYMCMASNWIITYNLLDSDKDYKTIKPRYIRSILCCMNPYLTEQGAASLEAALDELHPAQSA